MRKIDIFLSEHIYLLQKLTELDIIKRNFRRLEYGNLRHNTESQDGVLLVNSTATYFENDRILLEETVVGNQPMSVMIQEGQYGLL